MSTQPAPSYIHPLIKHETLTLNLLTQEIDRKEVSDVFYKIEEYDSLGRFAEAYEVLEKKCKTLPGRSPAHAYLFGRIKLHHGFLREGREWYIAAERLFKSAKVELSEESKMLAELIHAMIPFFNPPTPADMIAACEGISEVRAKWSENKKPEDLDYFSIFVENSYHVMIKNNPSLHPLLPEIHIRFNEILYAQIKKGNGVITLPFFMAILNITQSEGAVKELQSSLINLLKEHQQPSSLINTVEGYCSLRLGQLSFASDSNNLGMKHFKEARRLFKLAGNLEAPCEIDSFETIANGQKRMLANANGDADIARGAACMIKELGLLYGKFTELNYPNRMNDTLKVMFHMNDKMLGSQQLATVIARLWRQLGKATGIKITAPTEFTAVAADANKTDDIEDALAVCYRFKEETQTDWDAELLVAWLMIVGRLHSRMSLYDEAIDAFDQARDISREHGDTAKVAELATEILALKEQRLHTLPDEEAGYAFDDLIEELDEAARDDQNAGRTTLWVIKQIWKATLLVSNEKLVDPEEKVPQAQSLLASVESIVPSLIERDPTLRPIKKLLISAKVQILRAQKKFDEVLVAVEKELPSKWNLLKRAGKSDDDEMLEVQLRLLAVITYAKEMAERPEILDTKTVARWTKTCFSQLKETMKLAEKHQMADDYCTGLYCEAQCHLALGEPQKALPLLARAIRISDDILAASPKGDKFDSFVSNSLASAASASRIADSAIKACLQVPDIVECWSWIQKSKTRMFGDLMRHEGDLSDHINRIMDDVESFGAPWDDVSIRFSHVALLYRLQKLLETPVGYTLNNWDKEEMQESRNHRRKKIREITDQIEQVPELRGALSVWKGLPANHEDMQWLANYRSKDQSVVFVDWAHSYDELILSVYRPGGISMINGLSIALMDSDAEVKMFKCILGIKQVKNWVNEYLKNQDMPLESENAFDDLDILNDLIAPLSAVTKPGELLVFSPTDVLHGIPLHALKIGEKENGERLTLIERNPVVYTPSFSIMRQCVTRLRLARNDPTDLEPAALRSAALVGVKSDYGEDDPAVPASLKIMAENLNGHMFLGDECDVKTFTDMASSTTDIIHFHGHMDYQDSRPLQRYLVLGNDEKITGRQLADLKFAKRTAPLVAVIACLSGGQQILTGDEPIGVIPALMAAGAASVIATLWPTDSATGLKFGELLYKQRQECDQVSKIWNIANAVRDAVLEIMYNEKTKAPYYWAPFGLHGAWLRGTGKNGALPRGDGLDGLTRQFDKMVELRF